MTEQLQPTSEQTGRTVNTTLNQGLPEAGDNASPVLQTQMVEDVEITVNPGDRLLAATLSNQALINSDPRIRDAAKYALAQMLGENPDLSLGEAPTSEKLKMPVISQEGQMPLVRHDPIVDHRGPIEEWVKPIKEWETI